LHAAYSDRRGCRTGQTRGSRFVSSCRKTALSEWKPHVPGENRVLDERPSETISKRLLALEKADKYVMVPGSHTSTPCRATAWHPHPGSSAKRLSWPGEIQTLDGQARTSRVRPYGRTGGNIPMRDSVMKAPVSRCARTKHTPLGLRTLEA